MKKSSSVMIFSPKLRKDLKKTYLIMKLSILFILLTVLQANASIYSQSKEFNLSLQNATLLEVLNAIESQSDFKFFYQNEQINTRRTVSVNVEGAKVEAILDQLFANQNIHYRI